MRLTLPSFKHKNREVSIVQCRTELNHRYCTYVCVWFHYWVIALWRTLLYLQHTWRFTFWPLMKTSYTVSARYCIGCEEHCYYSTSSTLDWFTFWPLMKTSYLCLICQRNEKGSFTWQQPRVVEVIHSWVAVQQASKQAIFSMMWSLKSSSTIRCMNTAAYTVLYTHSVMAFYRNFFKYIQFM